VPPELAAQRRIAQDETGWYADCISSRTGPASRRVRRDGLPGRV